MSKDKRMAILKSIMSIAWSDGVFEDREQNMMDGITKMFQLEADEAEQLKAADVRRSDLSFVDMLTEYDERLFCYQQAVKMSLVDGYASYSERQMLATLKERFEITDDDAKTAEIAAKELIS